MKVYCSTTLKDLMKYRAVLLVLTMVILLPLVYVVYIIIGGVIWDLFSKGYITDEWMTYMYLADVLACVLGYLTVLVSNVREFVDTFRATTRKSYIPKDMFVRVVKLCEDNTVVATRYSNGIGLSNGFEELYVSKRHITGFNRGGVSALLINSTGIHLFVMQRDM